MGNLICLNKRHNSVKRDKRLHRKSKSDTTLESGVNRLNMDTATDSKDVGYEDIECFPTGAKGKRVNAASTIPDDKSYADVSVARESFTMSNSSWFVSVKGCNTNCQSDSSETFLDSDQISSAEVQVRNKRDSDYLHDMCAVCARKHVGSQATHICFTCSKYGRYYCYNCLQNHDTFLNGHSVQSLFSDVHTESKTSITTTRSFKSKINRVSKVKRPPEISTTNPCIGSKFPNEEAINQIRTEEWIKEQRRCLRQKTSVEKYEIQDLRNVRNVHETDLKTVIRSKIQRLDRAEDTNIHQQNTIGIRNHLLWKSDKLLQENGSTGETNIPLLQIQQIQIHRGKSDELNTEDADRTVLKIQSPSLKRSTCTFKDHTIPSKTLIRRHTSAYRSNNIRKQFYELYNKAWNEGFNSLIHNENKTEKEACAVLLSVLVKIYLTCKEKVQAKTTEVDTNIQEEDKTKRNKRLIKEISEESSSYFSETLSRQERSCLNQFTSKCCGVCLGIALIQPAICLDTDLHPCGKQFDKNLYKPQTEVGTNVDYIVWPALLHEDTKSVFCKGIVHVQTQVK